MALARAAVSCAVAIATIAAPAHAYRPFDGTDADVAALGELELEVGPIGYLRASHDSALVFANSVINYGLLPRWELVVQGTGLWGLDTPPPPRFIDGGAFLKRLLREGSLQGASGPSIATEFGILFPTIDGSRPAGTGLYLGLVASQAWREIVVHLNVELARSSDGQPDTFVGAIVEMHPRALVRPVLEAFVDRHDGQTEPSLLVGFVWRACDRLSIDAASRVAWIEGAPLFEARAGFTWSIGLVRP